MFAKVVCHPYLRDSFRYNELKVVKHKADCLLAVNFIKDAETMSMEDKLARFNQRNTLYEQAECNTVHISLNYSPNDKISDGRMNMLAQYYMEQIGFGDQPYLVYRHHDIHHPHVHILSTNITAEGDRIQMNEITNVISRQVAFEMEERFSLTKYERHTDQREFETDHAQILVHGESGTKRGISDVLNAVVPHYNYTTMEEYNAILRLYNVAAHQGEEGSRLRERGGLLYYALNEDGERASTPLKASSFLLKPTLSNLHERMTVNLEARATIDHSIDIYADWILKDQGSSWEGFKNGMERDGISVVVMHDKATNQESVYFIDHEKKLAVSGESLGRDYNLQSLQEKCTLEEQEVQQQKHRVSLRL